MDEQHKKIMEEIRNLKSKVGRGVRYERQDLLEDTEKNDKTNKLKEGKEKRKSVKVNNPGNLNNYNLVSSEENRDIFFKATDPQ